MKKANKQFSLGEYEFATFNYTKAINKNYRIGEANFKIGESLRLSNRLKDASLYYKNAIDNGYDEEEVNLYYAQSLKSQGKYDEAKQTLEEYLAHADDEQVKDLANYELTGLNQIDNILEKETYYRVKNLEMINTSLSDYAPYYVNGELYFSSNRYTGNNNVYASTGTPFSNIYKAKTRGAIVDTSTIEMLPSSFNSPNSNDGTVAFSPDGTIMVFAKGNSGRRKGAEDVDLYISRFRRNMWTEPQIMKLNDPQAWESSPAFTSDGHSIVFASNRKGGFGGTDLWIASMNNRGQFTNVRNLGPQINTIGNEMFPFVADDGSIYFASDGHPGLGGLDIFVAKRSGGKLDVENLGPPINTNSDDFSLFLFSIDKGFFSSNRPGGRGDDDIYTFVNNDPNLKVINYFLAGVTVTFDDGNNEVLLPSTSVKLFSTSSNELIDESVSDKEGRFLFRVYPEEDYYVIASKNDYLTSRNTFSTKGKSIPKEELTQLVTNKTFNTKIELNRIVINKSIVLENIYYDLDKWNIREDAAKELDKLVTILDDNPEISIELSSHTDSRQTADYNLELSKKRAQSAVEYIVSKGIDPKRITAKGYGESQLLISDAEIEKLPTEEEREAAHQRNRRTEFKILEYDKSKKPKDAVEEGELKLEESLDVDDDLENRINWDN